MEIKLKILAEVAAEFFGTPNLRLLEKHKKSHPQYEDTHRKKARHVAMWLACDAGYKQSDVARFWKVNHATVIYGCKKVSAAVDADPAEKVELKRFMEMVRARLTQEKIK
jgi:chromosomal replication initiation ATPase DnaA